MSGHRAPITGDSKDLGGIGLTDRRSTAGTRPGRALGPSSLRCVRGLLPGEEGTGKTFTRRGNKVVLVPANARLTPMEFDASEVTIYGKVVTVVRRL